MKRVVTRLFPLLFLAISAFAQDDNSKEVSGANSLSQNQMVVGAVEGYFSALNGVVASTDNEIIYSDIGADKKPYIGLIFQVLAAGENIVHPITGQILGSKQRKVGEAQITEINDNFSVLSFKKEKEEDNASVGDLLSLYLPAIVFINSGELSEERAEEIRGRFASSRFVKPVDGKNTEYSYELRLKELDGGLSFTLLYKGGVILAGSAGGMEYVRSVKVLAKTPLRSGDRFISFAKGKVRGDLDVAQVRSEVSEKYSRALEILEKLSGDDNASVPQADITAEEGILSAQETAETIEQEGKNIKNLYSYYIAAVTEDEAFILSADNYSVVEKLEGKFSKILNVETADLDGDGTDEIFISHFQGAVVKSCIYKHSNGAFVRVADDIAWFFRSVRQDGDKRKIFVQSISKDGEYRGDIYEFLFKDGKYTQGEVVKNSLGKRLFGFSSFQEGGEEFFLNIAIGAKLAVFSDKKQIQSVPGDFGDTFVNLFIKSTSVTDRGGSGGTPQRDKILYVHPRLEILEEGVFAAARNEMYTRFFVDTLVFSESFIDFFSFKDGVLTRIARSVEEPDPVIVDLYAYEEGGKVYLLVLKSNAPAAFSSKQSHITKYVYE